MWQLILKDFRVNWIYQLLSLVLLFLISALYMYAALQTKSSVDPDIVIYFMVVLLSTGITSFLFYGIDEISNTNEIIASLPVSRKQMVTARYTTTVVQVLLTLGFHFLGGIFGAYLQDGLDSDILKPIYDFRLWITIAFIVFTFSSYSYPLLYKFGLFKGMLIIGVGHFVLYVSFVITMILHQTVWGSIQEVIFWMLNLSEWISLPVFIAVSVLIMFGTLLASITIFKNKDI